MITSITSVSFQPDAWELIAHLFECTERRVWTNRNSFWNADSSLKPVYFLFEFPHNFCCSKCRNRIFDPQREFDFDSKNCAQNCPNLARPPSFLDPGSNYSLIWKGIFFLLARFSVCSLEFWIQKWQLRTNIGKLKLHSSWKRICDVSVQDAKFIGRDHRRLL